MGERSMDEKILKQLNEAVIGRIVLRYAEHLRITDVTSLIDASAVEVLSEIKEILNDQSEEDPTCFYRIDAIIAAYQARGIDIDRHDW